MLTSKKLRSHERVAYNKKMGSEDSIWRYVERDKQHTGVEGAPGVPCARRTVFCSGCPETQEQEDCMRLSYTFLLP